MLAKQVLVLGTAARGGIRSVIEAYESAGFYSPGHMQFIATHVEGSLVQRLKAALFAYLQVTRMLLLGKVELLHMHMSMRGSFWRKFVFLQMARMAAVPVIVHLHGSEFAVFYNSSPAWVKAAVRRLFDQAAGVVVLSTAWRDFVSGLTRNSVQVIGNFVPDHPQAARMGSERQLRHVLFMGQFGQRKGVYDLLPVFAKVARQFPDARLVCGGNGEVNKVREVVSGLGATDIIEVPGWVSGMEKAALLKRCGVFVLPSYNEGLPMAMIEAMSYGMAVVSTTVGGIPELVHDDNGALITPGDQEALADALVAILARDDAALRAMGAASRQRYESAYSARACMDEMRTLYLKLGVTA